MTIKICWRPLVLATGLAASTGAAWATLALTALLLSLSSAPARAATAERNWDDYSYAIWSMKPAEAEKFSSEVREIAVFTERDVWDGYGNQLSDDASILKAVQEVVGPLGYMAISAGKFRGWVSPEVDAQSRPGRAVVVIIGQETTVRNWRNKPFSRIEIQTMVTYLAPGSSQFKDLHSRGYSRVQRNKKQSGVEFVHDLVKFSLQGLPPAKR